MKGKPECLFSFKGTPGRPVGPVEFSNISKDLVTLSWHPPTKDGGKPVTNYIVEVKDSKCATWSKCGDVSADKTTFIVENLVEGHNYLFRVSAINKHGQSGPLEMPKPILIKSPFGKIFKNVS